MNAYLFEFIGTAVLILFGNGVVANFVLQGTKGSSAGWVGIALGWGIAVFVGVYISADISGSHINPAVTIGLAIAEKFDWNLVPGYVAAQVLGAMFGSGLVWLTYKRQYDVTTDEEAIRATFSTSPSIRDPYWNFITETIGTFILVFAVFFIAGGDFSGEAISLGSLDALPVALLVMGLGFSLGGPTGYAINPARDFGPRIMHALLPVKKEVRGSDWGYAWIPIVAPLTGGALAAFVYNLLAI